MQLKDMMSRDVEVIHPDATIQEAARRMQVRNIGSVIIAEGDHFQGILTDRDITLRVAAEGRDPTSIRGLTTPGLHNWGLVLVVAVLLGISWVGMGYGAPGDLDPTFGTGGIAITFGPKDIVSAMVEQPDAGEEAYWVDVLATQPTPDTVRGMLHVVFDGPEFRQHPVNPWQYVVALYQAMLERDPAPSELDWWVQAVLDRFNTLVPEFVDSPEFQRLVPSCQDQAAVTLLVGRLYRQVLRRVASAGELAWWTQDNIAGVPLKRPWSSFSTVWSTCASHAHSPTT
jgi:CBS domain-containing protein